MAPTYLSNRHTQRRKTSKGGEREWGGQQHARQGAASTSKLFRLAGLLLLKVSPTNKLVTPSVEAHTHSCSLLWQDNEAGASSCVALKYKEVQIFRTSTARPSRSHRGLTKTCDGNGAGDLTLISFARNGSTMLQRANLKQKNGVDAAVAVERFN